MEEHPTFKNPKLDQLYALLILLARENKCMPTNDQLCGILGFVSVSTPIEYLARLEKLGLIKITRMQMARSVYVKAENKTIHSARFRSSGPHWTAHKTRQGPRRSLANVAGRD